MPALLIFSFLLFKSSFIEFRICPNLCTRYNFLTLPCFPCQLNTVLNFLDYLRLIPEIQASVASQLKQNFLNKLRFNERKVRVQQLSISQDANCSKDDKTPLAVFISMSNILTSSLKLLKWLTLTFVKPIKERGWCHTK